MSTVINKNKDHDMFQEPVEIILTKIEARLLLNTLKYSIRNSNHGATASFAVILHDQILRGTKP